MKLSVIIPVFNEASTIEDVVEKVKKQPHRKEIIIVDDGSTDETRSILKKLKGDEKNDLKIALHDSNIGKGRAISTGLKMVDGDVIIIQDADLEYDPDDYARLLEPIIKGEADVVFGSRFLGTRRAFMFSHYIGNRLISTAVNILYDSMLTDINTGFKAFRADIIDDIQPIRSKGFGFETEFTAKVLKRGLRVYEVPISYWGRGYESGKKIKWSSTFAMMWWLLKEKISGGSAKVECHSALFDKIEAYIGTKVLELDAGEGEFSRYLIGKELLVLAESNPAKLRKLRARFKQTKRLKITSWDMQKLPALEIKPDTILCLNTLEKVKDDLGLLKNARRALRKRGRIIVKVPTLPIEGSKSYTEEEIKSKLTKADFLVEYKTHFDTLGIVDYALRKFKIYPPLRNAAAFLELPFGLYIVAVGEAQ